MVNLLKISKTWKFRDLKFLMSSEQAMTSVNKLGPTNFLKIDYHQIIMDTQSSVRFG
jgi:hypothetical protein